jgi:hypothetical protein
VFSLGEGDDMARAPRQPADDIDDPITEAVKQDQISVADELSDLLGELKGVDTGAIKGMLYRIPRVGGKYEYIRELIPPFNITETMDELRQDYGGGDYQIRIFVNGKIRKNINFSIAADPRQKSPLVTDKRGDNDLMIMMMQMQQSSADRQMQMMQAMTTMQAQSQQAASQQMLGLMTALIPAMMGNREKMSDIIPLMAAMNPKPEGGGLKESLEVLTIAKGLFSEGGSGGGDGDGSLISEAMKLGSQILPAIGNMIPKRPQAAPVEMSGEGVHMLPAPVPMPAPVRAPAETAENSPVTGVGPSDFPVLDMVREDVLFMFNRGRSPEMAADHVMSVLDAAGVTDADLFALIARFQASPNWIDELASAGIDLRSNPEWAFAFLGALVQLYTQDDGDHDDTGGGAGSGEDLGDHGGTESAGLPMPAGTGEG